MESVALQALIYPAEKNPKTIYRGSYGTFVANGGTIKLKSKIR